MDDSEIVDLYLQRNEAALEHTARKYGARLRRVSVTIVDDSSTAEECENDTYLEAWRRIPPHTPRTYLFAFLAKIIRNLSIDCCKSRERLKRKVYITELSEELECCIPSGEDLQAELEGRELAECISGFLWNLPQLQRRVFLRRYWYGDSIGAVSRRYLLEQSAVKSMLFRTRNALRDFLKKEGYTL